jgi:hypothetical protein
MHVGGSSLEMPTDESCYGGESELSSSSSGSFDDTNVESVSLYTLSPESSEEQDQSQHPVEVNVAIPLCAGFGREQWVGLDVVLLNDAGVPVANGICRNSNPRDCVDADPLGINDVGVCIMNSLLPLEVPVTWRFSLRRWPLRRVLHDEVSLWDHGRRHEQTQATLLANTRPRKGLRKYDSSRAPRGDKESRRARILGDESIRLVSAKDCCARRCCQFFQREKIRSMRQEMWLADFRMRSAKKLEVHRNLHIDNHGHKVVTLENVEVCCTAWYTIHAVSKADFYRFRKYSASGRRSRFHGNSGTKKPREATLQASATLSTIIVPLADAMPHKTRTLASGEKVVQMVLPTGTKWKNILTDINEVGRRAGCGPISSSKLSVIKNQQFAEYILKRPGDKFARCTTCEKYKGLRDAHPIGTESHTRHQAKYIEHVNNQEAHRQDYYKNRALSIMRPTEVLTVIHDKMDHAKTACPCYARKIKATDGLFKLPVAVTGLYEFINMCSKYLHCYWVCFRNVHLHTSVWWLYHNCFVYNSFVLSRYDCPRPWGREVCPLWFGFLPRRC